ncbi:MAG: hypothetical protein IPK53_19395 [bacterium]|nr:hypothetical protein [bacterium]
MFGAVTFRFWEDLHLATLERPSCIPIILADLSTSMARRLLRELVGVEGLPDAVEQHLGLRDRDGRDSPVSPLFLEESVNVMMSAGVLKRNGRPIIDEENWPTTNPRHHPRAAVGPIGPSAAFQPRPAAGGPR